MADTNDDEPLASDLVGQKLQSADEVYVYKIPPLKSAAAGHRYVCKFLVCSWWLVPFVRTLLPISVKYTRRVLRKASLKYLPICYLAIVTFVATAYVTSFV